MLLCKKGMAKHLSASGFNNDILIAIWKLIYNPVVIATLFFQYFVQIFLSLIIIALLSFLVFTPFKYLQIVPVSPS